MRLSLVLRYVLFCLCLALMVFDVPVPMVLGATLIPVTLKGSVCRDGVWYRPDARGQALVPKHVAIAIGQHERAEVSTETKQKSDPNAFDKPLPEGFPVRDVLTDAAYDTPRKVSEAPSEVLLALKGIGDSTLEKIEEALAELA